MTADTLREPSFPILPSRSMRQRIRTWVELFKFAWVRGGSAPESARLFYYTALKPPLAFRGWSRYSPERILSFSIKAAGHSRFQVYARDNGLEPGTIAEFFSPQSTVLPAELPPLEPKVIYDLGANIGIASLRLATLYPDARFYGFEPLPLNHEVCVLNYKNLRKAEAFPWAVGSRTEVTAFQCNEDPRGGQLQAAPANPGSQPRPQIQVQVYSLLDLIHVKKLAPPDFMKIDVEGAELEVLRGMGDAVQSVKRLFVETHGAQLKAECLNWMRERGFQIWPSPDPTALWGDRG